MGGEGSITIVGEFGTIKISPLTDETFKMVKSDYNYVNVHSKAHPKGIIRGQINN